MKLTSLLPSTTAIVAVVAMLSSAVFAAAPVAQTPQDQPAPPAAAGAPQQGMGRMRNFPAPTNLKVLPKDLTGAQVRDIMETWAGSLGVHCDFCHAPDPNNVGPNGRPRLNFADDSKPNKQIARIMYTMTEQVNGDYITKSSALDADAMGKKVTCGTCHRGHEMPEEFVIPKEQPRGGGGMAPGMAMPPAGAPPSN